MVLCYFQAVLCFGIAYGQASESSKDKLTLPLTVFFLRQPSPTSHIKTLPINSSLESTHGESITLALLDLPWSVFTIRAPYELEIALFKSLG